MLAMRDEMRDELAVVRADIKRVDSRLDGIESTINRHQDELTFTTAMVMRHASEPIAWHAMERQIKALAERLASVEKRRPAAE